MRRRTRISICLGQVALVGLLALAASAAEPLLDQVRKNREELIRSQISAPPEATPASDLDEAVRRIRSITLRPPRSSVPAATPVTPGTAPQEVATAPREPPAESRFAKQISQLKTRSVKDVADPLALADALFLGRHWAEAGTFYQRVLEDAATPDDIKPWLLFQTANCQRRTDPVAAGKLYDRLVAEHPKCPWAKPAAIYKTLIQWRQSAQPEALLQALPSDNALQEERAAVGGAQNGNQPTDTQLPKPDDRILQTVPGTHDAKGLAG